MFYTIRAEAFYLCVCSIFHQAGLGFMLQNNTYWKVLLSGIHVCFTMTVYMCAEACLVLLLIQNLSAKEQWPLSVTPCDLRNQDYVRIWNLPLLPANPDAVMPRRGSRQPCAALLSGTAGTTSHPFRATSRGHLRTGCYLHSNQPQELQHSTKPVFPVSVLVGERICFYCFRFCN